MLFRSVTKVLDANPSEAATLTGTAGPVIRNSAKLRSEAQDHFGLPDRPLAHWPLAGDKLPWRAPEGSAPSPRALVDRTG